MDCRPHTESHFQYLLSKLSAFREITIYYPLQYSCLENSMDRGTWQAKQRNLASCSPWGGKKSDTTKWFGTYHYTKYISVFGNLLMFEEVDNIDNLCFFCMNLHIIHNDIVFVSTCAPSTVGQSKPKRKQVNRQLAHF